MPTLKGAFVRYEDSLALPNIIVFQFNPETMTRNPSLYEKASSESSEGKKEPLAVTGMPRESLSFTLRLDASDKIASGDVLAKSSGILPAISALELLLYPREALDLRLGAAPKEARNPPDKLPVVLFVWGLNRVLPVKISSLSINEMQYDTMLNPVRAEVSVSMEVITPPNLDGFAEKAYSYTLNVKKIMAAANLVGEARDLGSMLI